MDWRAKVDLFEQLRREHEFGVGTIAGVAAKFGVHRRLVRQAMADAGLAQVPILAGGAALKQSTALALNVDFVGQTAFDAVKYLDPLFGDPIEQH